MRVTSKTPVYLITGTGFSLSLCVYAQRIRREFWKKDPSTKKNSTDPLFKKDSNDSTWTHYGTFNQDCQLFLLWIENKAVLYDHLASTDARLMESVLSNLRKQRVSGNIHVGPPDTVDGDDSGSDIDIEEGDDVLFDANQEPNTTLEDTNVPPLRRMTMNIITFVTHTMRNHRPWRIMLVLSLHSVQIR